MKRYWLMLLGLVIGGTALLSLGKGDIATHHRQVGQSQAMSQPQRPRSQMQGIKLIEQADQSTAWEIIADHAEFSEDANVAVAHGVHAQLFQDNTVVLSLEAERSTVQRDTGNITMQGHVRVIHRDGYTMSTKTLNWQAEARQLYTNEAVELEGQNIRVTGIGLQSDVDRQRFHLEQNIHASFQLRKAPAPRAPGLGDDKG